MMDSNPNPVMHKVKRWLKNQIVQDVPEDIALCEFDCRKGQCRMGEWESCERRITDLQDLHRSQTRKPDCDQLSPSKDKFKMAESNGGTGKRQGDPETSLLSSDTGDNSKPEKQSVQPMRDRGSRERQGDAEGRLVRRVATKTKPKQ
jgi:hypothetical protein